LIPSFPKLPSTFTMADTKPVETAPVAEPVIETKAAEETPAAPAATTEAPATETEVAPAAAETAEAPAATEEAKKEEEVKPVEEGQLAHKGEGANFPKYVQICHGVHGRKTSC